MSRAPMREDISPLFRRLIGGLRPMMQAATRQDWSGGEHLPTSGGFVLACNHLSYTDPLTLGHFLVDHGRAPHYLAKSSLLDVPVLGHVVRETGQIPVYRNTTRAADAFSAAVEAVRGGACVVVMPEGTLTRDPDLWPMRGKTGAARIALETGAPLIPTAMWGSQELLWPYRGKVPKVLPRKTIQVSAGAPIDLSDLPRPVTAEGLRVATDRLMAAITTQLEQLRGATAPAERFTFDHTSRSRRGESKDSA